jgi:hypothetical protein
MGNGGEASFDWIPAKRAVEIAIEQSEAAALAFLNNRLQF